MSAIPFFDLNTFILPNLFQKQEPEVAKLQIGRCECLIMRDNILSYSSKDFFLDVPQAELLTALRRYNINPENMPSPFIGLLLKYDERRVLIDTGMGFAEKPVMIGDHPFERKGRIQHLLASENIKNEEITDVIITHFHPDHIGGIYNENKNLNYPNATYHMPQKEWDFWHSSKAENASPFFKFFIADQITPLKDQDLNLFSGDFNEIVPNVFAVEAFGHTPGHIAVDVNFDEKHLLYISDAFLHPLHMENLHWRTRYDMDHEKAQESRIKLLDLAYRENMIVNAFHFDFPGLGRVEKEGTDWKWKSGV